MTTRDVIVRVLALALLAAPLAAQTCDPTEAAKLLASDGVAGDVFGTSVGVSGDVAIVGAPYESAQGSLAGAAYVYRFDGVAWTEETKLLASDGHHNVNFGASVSIFGDTALVGAPGADGDNGTRTGAAYVFRFDGAQWVEDAKLSASDGFDSDGFGNAVALSDAVALIGASHDQISGFLSGSAYVFRFDGANWSQEAQILPSDAHAEQQFGGSVAISGDAAIIGAPYDDDDGSVAGAAYAFGFNGPAWVQQAKLLASDGAPEDTFGQAVAIDGETIVIGAGRADDNGSVSGSAYTFRFNGSSWAQEAKL